MRWLRIGNRTVISAKHPSVEHVIRCSLGSGGEKWHARIETSCEGTAAPLTKPMQTNYQSKHGKGGCFRSSVIRIHQQSRAVISIDNERLMFSLRWFEFKRNTKKKITLK